jgi:hypothetical protein
MELAPVQTRLSRPLFFNSWLVSFLGKQIIAYLATPAIQFHKGY